MSDILHFTFRTNKQVSGVKRHGINPFIFGPLKKDFEVFSKTILEVKPKYIIGFANISTKSHIESLTVNKFGKKGRILSDGADSYALYLPKRSQFAVSNKPTNSFCNWTMYKIAELIEKEKLKTKLIFVHVNHIEHKGFSTMLGIL